MPDFGNTSIKAEHSENWLPVMGACKYALAEEAVIQSISLYLYGAAGDVRMAIYADSAGAPAALQCETGIQAVSAGWNTVATATNPTLQPGDYWLAFQLSSNTPKPGDQAGDTDQECYVTHAWGAFVDPFGAPFAYRDLDRSHYATYDVVAVAGYAAIF